MRLQPTTLAGVRALPGAMAAEREHVSLKPVRMRVAWSLILDDDGQAVGFVGHARTGQTTSRLKGVYVFPQHRGKGYGSAASLAIVERARTRGHESIDQYAAHPAWWIAQGWEPLAEPTRTGIQHLILRLDQHIIA